MRQLDPEELHRLLEKVPEKAVDEVVMEILYPPNVDAPGPAATPKMLVLEDP